MKGLTTKYLKIKFFREGKNEVIIDYLDSTSTNNFKHYQYTNGTEVWVDTLTERAYTRNGVLFAVILKDNDYLADLWENHKDEILAYLDNEFDETETEEDEEDEDE